MLTIYLVKIIQLIKILPAISRFCRWEKSRWKLGYSTNAGISINSISNLRCIRHYSLGTVGFGWMSKIITNVRVLTNRFKTRR